MANNKVQLADGTTLIDLTDTTAAASDVATGKYFYTAAGVKTEGTASGGGTAAISVVDTTDSHGGTVRTITALDISDTTAVAADVAQGKYFYTAEGVKTAGTGSGGGGLTQHEIHLEFTDSTDTDIEVDYDNALLATMITAYEPTGGWTYNNKTVDSAALDNVIWYQRQSEVWETLWDGASTNVISDTPYNYFWIPALSDVYPTAGSVWRVTADGMEYRCTASLESLSAGTLVCFGNPKFSGGTDDGSSAPFCFYNAGWGAMVGDTELTAGNHSVKIERLVVS